MEVIAIDTTLDALRPIRREERLRLAAVLWGKAAARKIINVSEELYKAKNNEIIRMVTGMREGDGVEKGGGDNPNIQLVKFC
ncbi:hypothetical protein QJS10_CPB13g01032 [Acorus calamus]|uniref:Uncharacterized protein n=1 Tax=Acorus calamus TaxID=4465 RepID=A0AAV9DI96_ACOCL|nr:hypothetical protein QJS10_CPB13g01032 [Acorus calamus]